MKLIFALLLILTSNFTCANETPNRIVAIVDENNLITSNSIQDKLLNINSIKEKIKIIETEIDIILQLKKIKELKIKPSEEDINKALFKIADNNNLSLDELLSFEELPELKKEISKKLSILHLRRYITKDIEYPKEQIKLQCSNYNLIKDQKQIKIAQIIISEIDSDIKDPEQKVVKIKLFLKKLSKHISKGASFEAFAKLHSQHPSYKDGGLTDWLLVNNSTLKMLDSLKKNEVSEIYQTTFGLAIAIKTDERFISSKLKECEERVIYQNAEIYYAKWLETLREQSIIEIYYDKL